MGEYISKDALISEIERRIKVLQNNSYENHKIICHLDSLKQTINTLDVKEVDLEKEYDNEFFKDPVFGILVNRNAGISIAKHFFELGLKVQKGE